MPRYCEVPLQILKEAVEMADQARDFPAAHKELWRRERWHGVKTKYQSVYAHIMMLCRGSVRTCLLVVYLFIYLFFIFFFFWHGS